MSAQELVAAQAEGRSLMVPAALPPNLGGRHPTTAFDIQVEERRAVCPAGQVNTQCSRLVEQATGKVTFRFEWGSHCPECPMRARCVAPGQPHRSLVVGEHHSALPARRREQTTPTFLVVMNLKTGAEMNHERHETCENKA